MPYRFVTPVKAKSKNWSKFGHIVDGIKAGLRHFLVLED